MRRNGEADGAPGPSAPWQPPPVVEGYSVVRPLGRGGMGQVYLGRDPGLDRPVALKFIAGGAPSAAARERFLIEARAIARLSHPNIVAIYRVGEVDGRPYIAYELVSGLPLSQHIVPLPWPQVVQVLLGVARGLEAAHGAGILHRDVKPANVMVSDRGEIKLIDFGLAKLDGGQDGLGAAPEGAAGPLGALPDLGALTSTLQPQEGAAAGGAGLTATGALLGTPAYVAPELWRGRPASMRTDLFAVGLLGYELLVGALPHAGLDMLALASYLTSQELPPVRAAVSEVPASLSELIARCLRRDPEERIESARALRRALEDIERVFLPAGAEIVSRPERALLRISFARLRQGADAFAAGVYERLFQEAPAVRALFPKELGPQRQKLLHFLHLAIEGLDDPERLVPALEDLGRRHAAYGVRAEHFDPLRRALLGAVLAFDGGADPRELEAAWGGALSAIEAVMLRGLSQGAETLTSGIDAEAPEAAVATPGPARPPSPAAPAAPAARPSLPTPSLSVPETLYAYNGDVSLAYQVYGQGSGELVVFGWNSHVEAAWQQPDFATFLRRLGRLGRVLVFDKRGTGMSDRALGDTTLEMRVDDLEVVIAAAGFRRPALLGTFDGAAHAAAFAARRPADVRGLILYAPLGRYVSGPDYPFGVPAESIEPMLASYRSAWGTPHSAFVKFVAASRADDPAFCSWLAGFSRQVMSPGELASTMRALAGLNVLPLLPLVDVPALVMKREADSMMLPGAAEDFAARLPRGRFVSLPGADYLPFIGDMESLLRQIAGFLAGLGSPKEAPAPAPAPLRVALAVAADGPALQRAEALLAGRLGAAGPPLRRPQGSVAVLLRCAEAVELAGELHATGEELRVAISAGLYGDEASGLVDRALAQAAASPPGQTSLDGAASALLSGTPQSGKGSSSPRLTPAP